VTPQETLRQLIAGGSPTKQQIDAFVAGHQFPLTDPHGVTFVYRGYADHVVLRMFIFGLPTAQPLSRSGRRTSGRCGSTCRSSRASSTSSRSATATPPNGSRIH
jgi:hypothetical protein